MNTSDKISILAIVIAFLSLFVSGFIGNFFAIRSFKKQARLTAINSLIQIKGEFIDYLETFSIVGTQVAVKEYKMQPDKLGEIPEPLREKYWTSVYNGLDFEELYIILGELSKLNFEQILNNRNPLLAEQFKALKALRTNRYMSNAERCNMVFQICFSNKLYFEIKKIEDDFIRQL